MLVKNLALKYILATVLIILSLAHIQKIVFVGIGLNQISLPIFILMGVALLKENKNLYSLSFILMATVNILLLEGSDTLGAVPIFLLALVYCSNKYVIMSIISIIPTVFVLNAYIFGRTDFQNIPLSIIGNFAFLTFLYLVLIKKPKSRVDLWKEISEKEKAILKLYIKGYDYSKISHILNLNDKKDSIRTAITRTRKLSKCENDIKFGIWLSDKG